MIRASSVFVRLLFEVADEVRREIRKRRAAKAWAETPIHPRKCQSCGEIAYVPGQYACAKCGNRL